MTYGSALPVTGGAGALLFGHYFGLDDIIAAAIAVVLFGITAYRFGSRIGKARNTILIGVASVAATTAGLVHVGGLTWGMSITAGLSTAMVLLAIASRLTVQDAHAAA